MDKRDNGDYESIKYWGSNKKIKLYEGFSNSNIHLNKKWCIYWSIFLSILVGKILETFIDLVEVGGIAHFSGWCLRFLSPTFNWSNCISGQIIKNYFFIWLFFTNCNPKNFFFEENPFYFFLNTLSIARIMGMSLEFRAYHFIAMIKWIPNKSNFI